METQTKRTDLWTWQWGGEDGEGGTNGESSTETYPLTCVKIDN